jgi:sugar phosphate isomerase/epimerase
MMNTSRRTFIKNGALAVAGAGLLGSDLLAAPKKIERLGLQLYSVREDMKKDPKGTLKALADMEYKHVEHAGYADRKFYGYSPAEFKKLLDDLGLLMPSGHSQLTAKHWDAAKGDFTDEWKYTVGDAAIAGQKYVISPWLDENLRGNAEALKRFMDIFNKSGELCRQHGMKFGYHNHNFEFKTMVAGKSLYDFILTHTDPGLVAQQMDIGNMIGAGGVALDLIRQYPGRFELMHVKDEIKSDSGEGMDGYDSTILGKGVMPLKQILAEARKIGGTSQFVIEQESYQGLAPLACVKIDLQIMKRWGY